jgi:hypothetical protein
VHKREVGDVTEAIHGFAMVNGDRLLAQIPKDKGPKSAPLPGPGNLNFFAHSHNKTPSRC